MKRMTSNDRSVGPRWAVFAAIPGKRGQLVLVALLMSMACSKDAVQVPEAQDPTDYYVSVQSGKDTNNGKKSAPFKTIQHAIDAAAGTGGNVFVAEGTYAESLTLKSRVNLWGGYKNGTFDRNVTSYETVINGGATAVSATNVDSVTVDGFTIKSADATQDGQSSIVVSLNASTRIVVSDNSIVAGNGAVGADGLLQSPASRANGGSNGDNAIAQPFECDGSEVVGGNGGASPFGNHGGKGGNGGPAGGGSDGGNGVGPGGNGGPGGDLAGSNGDDGAGGSKGDDGPGGAGFGGADGGLYVTANGLNGADGAPGGGGGGGGGGEGTPIGDCGASGGGGGAGGLGGPGGSGGKGGGASIAVLLTNGSRAVIKDNSISTGIGGGGGNGAVGTGGQQGGDRGLGGGAVDDVGSAGGHGGLGGNGGQGGHGGGGGGGPSVGVVEDATSSSTRSGNSFTAGTGGNGGTSPGSPGAKGEQTDFKKLP
jgi:hypothetical protein